MRVCGTKDRTRLAFPGRGDQSAAAQPRWLMYFATGSPCRGGAGALWRRTNLRVRFDLGGRAPLLNASSRDGVAPRAADYGPSDRLPADGYVGAALLPRRGNPEA